MAKQKQPQKMKQYNLSLDPSVISEVNKILRRFGGKKSSLIQVLLEEWVSDQKYVIDLLDKTHDKRMNQKAKDIETRDEQKDYDEFVKPYRDVVCKELLEKNRPKKIKEDNE